MFRAARSLPFVRVLAIAQVVLLVRRHLMRLQPDERRRLAVLVRRGPGLGPAEREELRGLVGKLEPRAFAFAAANAVSPVRVPRGRR